MTPDAPEAAEIEAAAEAVAAGTDAIAVPQELTQETPGKPAVVPESEAGRSLWAEIQTMTVAQRVKLAMKGNKDARSILIRSTNRLIQRMVLQNPRLTEDEVLAIAKNRNSDEELLRQIADSREFTSSYGVRAALAENPKTPIAQAIRLVSTLGEREIANLAKSKNVPNAIAAQARKILFVKMKR
jgi:hypothetical protein